MENQQNTPAPAAKPPEPAGAWQPFTARGVTAFGPASWRRLWLVQFLVAIFIASMTVWLAVQAWVPVLDAAIAALPDSGRIQEGRLSWPGDSPVLLAENRFVSFAVELEHEGTVHSAAHLNLELADDDWTLSSIFGRAKFVYPRGYIIALNKPEATPWWGAWRLPLLASGAALLVAALMLSWTVVAFIYSLPLWLIAFFADRELKLSEAPRVAGAALMPGTVLLGICIFLYASAALDLMQIAFAAALHILTGWAYLIAAVAALPPCRQLSANPFVTGKTVQAAAPPRS